MIRPICRLFRLPLLPLGLLVLAAACGKSPSTAGPASASAGGSGGTTAYEAAPAPSRGQIGGPLPGLDDQQLAAFQRGFGWFARRWTVEEGHGPHFNQGACLDCHDKPGPGGGSDMSRKVRIVFDPPDFVEVWPEKNHPGYEPLALPSDGVVTYRRAPSLLGLGLLESVADEAILANCDPAKRPAGGVSVRANIAFDGRPGRIGFKAHTSSIRDFVAGALTRELGLTNTVIRVLPFRKDADKVPDPEVSEAVVNDLTAYVQGLAPPPRGGDHPAGEAIFGRVGCADCHKPDPAPSAKGAYTDLCVHGLGPAFDSGTPDMGARADQWRTAPLWGLRFRKAYFHDDRAASLDEAIRMHGGEGKSSADRYAALDEADRVALRAFLDTL